MGRRFGLLVLCCTLSVPAASPPLPVLHTPRDTVVLRSARHLEDKPTERVTLHFEPRDSEQLARADAGLVTAISELERQAQEITSPSLRALFAERARALLVLTSDVQIMRDRYAAALWFSDRARRVVTRTFSPAPDTEDGDAERLGRQLVKSVPAGVTAVHQELQRDQLLTWVVRDGKVHFVSTSVRSSTLATDIERLRTNPTRYEAQHLYGVLLRPVQQHLHGSELLVYSPAPELRGVPVAMLHDGESFLIERQPIVVAQSLSTFLAHFGQHAAVGAGPALITLPAAAPGSPPLQGAREEARVVVKTYGARGMSLLGPDASRSSFVAMAPYFDVIHIATHGHADVVPLQSAIEFGSDRLHAWEILNLRLTRGPVVILAGCRTGDETEGRTTISLSSAFAAAGASAVVGSLWDVEDRSTSRLMIDFHHHLSRGVSPPKSLALAQQSAMARNERISNWAAFQVQM